MPPAFRIRYGDSPEWRGISQPRSFSAAGIVVYCYLRKQGRTFNWDRIVEAIDMETGEILTAAQFRAALR